MTGRMRNLTSAASVPIGLYALLSILMVPVFPHFTSPNELTRWAFTVAVVDHGTFEVTRVIAENRLQNVEDLSSVGGRLYSNKAPGAAVLTIPAYIATRPFTGRATGETMRPTLNAMRIGAATIPVIVLALTFAAVARRLGRDESRVASAVTILLFATPLFAYGLLLFGHALSAAALFITWALLFVFDRHRGRDFAAGAVIGLAVLNEYQNVVPAAALLVFAFPRLRIAGMLRVLAGGVPFACLLAIYNRIAFGGWFNLSSGHEIDPAYRELARSGLFGVGLPSPAGLASLLLDSSKGLLVLSPVLILWVMRLRGVRAAVSGPAFAALITAPALLLLTISGYPNWHGGWTVGARYLVATLPFLVLPIAFGQNGRIERFLTGASVAVVALVSLVFPFVPPQHPAPWMSFAWPILADGLVAPNLLHLVARPLAIVVPFAIVLGAVVWSGDRRHLLFAVAGMIVWIAGGVVADRMHTEPRVARALIREVYFDRRGAIRAELPPAPGIPRLEAMARELRRQPPRPWPF